MNGRHAHKLNADCTGSVQIGDNLVADSLTNSYVDVCEPFKVASVHIFHSTDKIYYPNFFASDTWHNACGCGQTRYWDPATTTTTSTTTTPPPGSTTTSTSTTPGLPGEDPNPTTTSTTTSTTTTTTAGPTTSTTTTTTLSPWVYVDQASSLVKPTLAGPSGYIYGLTPKENKTRFSHFYFKTSELEPWRTKRITSRFNPQPPGKTDYPRIFRSGPSLRNGHACYPIRRRVYGEPEYQRYQDWYFTDPHPNALNNKVPVHETLACCHEDWLGYTYPAKWIWHNKGVEQPFNADKFWEDSGVNVEARKEAALNYMEFCVPMTAYDAQGVPMGKFVGYTHMIFFNNNMYMCGNDYYEDNGIPFDPTDSDAGRKVNKKVQRYQDAMSIDVHYYLYGVPFEGKVLKSPRIGSIRHWRPNTSYGKDSGVFGVSCCRPYLYWWCGEYTSNWWIDVEYQLLEGGSEVINHGLSTPMIYMTA